MGPPLIGKEIEQLEDIFTSLVNTSLYAYGPWCVEVFLWDALGKDANRSAALGKHVGNIMTRGEYHADRVSGGGIRRIHRHTAEVGA